MTITILMCTYQGSAYVTQQLASFAAQTGVSCRLWVSDDGSSDGTVSHITRYGFVGEAEPRIVKGPGQGFAANFLSLICHPDLETGTVALSDQDDVWFAPKLARAEALLASCDPERPAMVCGRTMLTDGDLNELGPSRLHRHFSFRNALVQNVVAGNTIVLNAAAHRLVRAAGVVDVPYHDWWCYQLISGAGGQILYDPEPCMFYRQHGGNVIGENRSLAAVLRRAGSFGSRTWRGWFERNLDALHANRHLLTPAHRGEVARWQALPRNSALGRARALAALRPHRQRRLETAALYGGVLLGLA